MAAEFDLLLPDRESEDGRLLIRSHYVAAGQVVVGITREARAPLAVALDRAGVESVVAALTGWLEATR